LKELADGNHPFNEKIKKAEFPMIILSAEVLGRSDGEAIMN
jgi:hypothetical protein